MLDYKVNDFLTLLASSKAVPGGGGASALVGSIGVALGSMVGELTLGKKKYADVQDDIKTALTDANFLMNQMNNLVLADAIAFEPLSKAYGLPKNTESERIYREQVMQEALIGAVEVPLDIARQCQQIVDVLEVFNAKGTRIAISDVAVGAWCCLAALKGAKLNVLINLKLMKNIDLVNRIETEINTIEEHVEKRCHTISNQITNDLARRTI